MFESRICPERSSFQKVLRLFGEAFMVVASIVVGVGVHLMMICIAAFLSIGIGGKSQANGPGTAIVILMTFYPSGILIGYVRGFRLPRLIAPVSATITLFLPLFMLWLQKERMMLEPLMLIFLLGIPLSFLGCLLGQKSSHPLKSELKEKMPPAMP